MVHHLRYVKNPLVRHGFVSKERRKLKCLRHVFLNTDAGVMPPAG